MSEQKMGTHYVREICEIFNAVAGKTPAAPLKEKLTALAGELGPLATKLYFKTQKGTEDMERIAEQMAAMQDELATADAAKADSMVAAIVDELEKTIKHVKTMKVRMT